MTKKIFRSILSASLTVLLLTLLIVTGFLYDYFSDVQKDELRDELGLAALATEQMGDTYLQQIDSDRYRLTWVDTDGTVLFDTQAERAEMENHADRQEIKDAFTSGTGSSSRYSATLTRRLLYEAMKLSDGTVLRISTEQVTAWLLVLGMLQPILVIAIVAMILSGVLAHRMSRRVVEPLNQLNLDQPLENDTYEELSPLLNRIHAQRKEIDRQLQKLKRQTNEFEKVTANMKEGLILLDGKHHVLSINPSARMLCDVHGDVTGEAFLSIDRSLAMSQAIEAAVKDGHSEYEEDRGGQSWQFDISRVDSSGEAAGLVILAFDVSEQAYAERTRREFSANVSHELKTPLTSIIASADLIENDLVKDGDLPRFIGHIKKEASRLLTLIEDIIRLSQLDEGVEMPAEPVDVAAMAKEAVEQLRDTADKTNVHLSLNAESCVLQGVPRLLHEIIYNLAENAIKYNVSGGSVDVSVCKTADGCELKVSDTGIGIPVEHQDRIFERFYRVDKSHSRQSGGTGLGLSIVKHAASYFNAEIFLQSEVGKGTTITVNFPVQK